MNKIININIVALHAEILIVHLILILNLNSDLNLEFVNKMEI
jgi:hypothetical protein